MAIHYKGITITPGGFLAAETVWRQRATTRHQYPLERHSVPGASPGPLVGVLRIWPSVARLDAGPRQVEQTDLTGYFETDFLGAGVTSNNNQSNSYVLRQRQLWGQAALQSGWTFTGGQMWSLVTETRKGEDNRTEALPMTIDPQYTVGLAGHGNIGFRVTKNFNNKVWFGFSVENSQTLLTALGSPANF